MNSILQSIILAYSLQLGHVYQDHSLFSMVETYPAWFSSVTIEGSLYGVFLSSTNLVEFDKAEGYQFQPLTEEYTIAMGYRFGGFTLSYLHECVHPVTSIGHDNTKTGLWSYSQDRVSIEYKGSVKPFYE